MCFRLIYPSNMYTYIYALRKDRIEFTIVWMLFEMNQKIWKICKILKWSYYPYSKEKLMRRNKKEVFGLKIPSFYPNIGGLFNMHEFRRLRIINWFTPFLYLDSVFQRISTSKNSALRPFFSCLMQLSTIPACE